MKDHIHVQLDGGAMASVDPDCAPETINALNEMVKCVRAAAERGELPESEGDSSAASCSAPGLGSVIQHGFKDGTPQAQRFEAIAECSICGKDVPLWAEANEWTEANDGEEDWEIAGYGPATGSCCKRLYADVYGEIEEYELC